MTQGLYLVLSVSTMYILFFIVGIIAFSIWGKFMDIRSYLMLNIGSLLLNLVVCGIGFLATCLFNSSAKTAAVATGLPLGSFLMYVVATFFGKNKLLSLCRYFSIHTLYNPAEILANDGNVVWKFAVMGLLVVSAFLAGGCVFEKKDLPL